MKCPNCGLDNPSSALNCDCGYNFEKKQREPQSLKEQAERLRNESKEWLRNEHIRKRLVEHAPVPTTSRSSMEDRQSETITTLPLEFTGKEGEYFKIWIVNIFLTILTLGIYSAWAKVRKQRYFYGNTLLQDSAFEYLADPRKILKGRLIVFGIFILYVVSANFFPLMESFSGLLFLAVMPWLVVKARTFRSRNSSYRNIRFDFVAAYGEAYKVFFWLPILAGLVGGLAYPYFACQRSRFVISHSSYGTTPFIFKHTPRPFWGSTQVRSFYGIYASVVILSLGALLLWVLFFVVFGALISWLFVPSERVAYLGFALVAFGLFLALFAYLKTQITNLVWSNTSIGDNRFESTLATSEMIWIYLSNAVAIALSLGLLIPWASIRVVRYRLHNIKLLAQGDLDGFVAAEQEKKVAAAGEEMSDFFDVDFGI